MSALTDTQIRWFRLRRSGLVEPFDSPESAASALAGIQAQILPAAGLALWNRTSDLTHDQFDSLLHQTRTLVKLWGQRGTLHVYASQDWPLICGALSGQRTWWERAGEKTEGSIEGYRAVLARVEKLLYRFDPLLLGIKDKSWIVNPQHYKRVFRTAGHIEGALVEHGQAVATWRYDRKNGGLVITVLPFDQLTRRAQTAVEKNAQGAAAFLGLPLADLTIQRETS